MPTDTTQVVIPSRVALWLAPVGSTGPVDSLTALPSPWVNVGYTTPDSVSMSTSPEWQELMTAQSDYPVLRYQTKDSCEVSIDLLQWNTPNFKSVFNGGAVVELTPATTPKTYKYTPPQLGGATSTAAVLDCSYAGKHYRFVYPNCQQTSGVQLDLHKGAESHLPLKLSVNGGDQIDAWFLLTDNAAAFPIG